MPWIFGVFVLIAVIGLERLMRGKPKEKKQELFSRFLFFLLFLLSLVLAEAGRIPWSGAGAILTALFVSSFWNRLKRTSCGCHGGPSSDPCDSSSSPMSEERASEILGVPKDAAKEEILKAYTALMTKVHPDVGGSEYLAKEVNLAKETLLKRQKT